MRGGRQTRPERVSEHLRGGKGRPRAGWTKVRKQSIRPRWPFCDRAGTGNPLAINSHSRSPKPHACTCEDADEVQLLLGETRRVGGQGGGGHVCCVFPDTLAAGADWASCDLKLQESGRLQIQIYISEEALGVRAQCAKPHPASWLFSDRWHTRARSCFSEFPCPWLSTTSFPSHAKLCLT